MEEVPDVVARRRWSEEELQALLPDLALLHDAFAEVPSTDRGPLGLPLSDYLARIQSHGRRAGVVLPERLELALDDVGPLLELLADSAVTLVHTDPYPRNVRQPTLGTRVWIDWEDAVFGPAALDLAGWLLDGPWSLGRPLDRTAALDVYCDARAYVEDRSALERGLDAALVTLTLTQDLVDLAARPDAIRAFVDERLAALDRLGM